MWTAEGTTGTDLWAGQLLPVGVEKVCDTLNSTG